MKEIKRRICHQVIAQMLALIPKSEVDLIADLNVNFDDSVYKAPEETIQWVRTQKTLMEHIPNPEKDWEFEVLSVFTTQSVDEIKQMIELAKLES